MSNVIEIITPVGRLVQGHPMEINPVKDDKTGIQKTNVSGEPQVSVFVAIAIPKGSETHWAHTEWGRSIWKAGAEGWPNGEFNSPSFAWKVVDGDSQVPDKKGIKPSTREGFPGHWVVKCNNGFAIPCYHANRYQPHEVIQNKAEIKRGDYIRLVIQAKGNAPSQSPGVYLNPSLFELTRAGVEIVVQSGPDASETFGKTQAVMPTNALIDPNIPGVPGVPNASLIVQAGGTLPGVGAQINQTANVPGAVAPPTIPTYTPVPEFLSPDERFNVSGTVYTRSQLLGFGWTEEQIKTQSKV